MKKVNGVKRKLFYPLSAMKLTIAFHPFSWKFIKYTNNNLTEKAKSTGLNIWTLKIACFSIGYSRLL